MEDQREKAVKIDSRFAKIPSGFQNQIFKDASEASAPSVIFSVLFFIAVIVTMFFSSSRGLLIAVLIAFAISAFAWSRSFGKHLKIGINRYFGRRDHFLRPWLLNDNRGEQESEIKGEIAALEKEKSELSDSTFDEVQKEQIDTKIIEETNRLASLGENLALTKNANDLANRLFKELPKQTKSHSSFIVIDVGILTGDTYYVTIGSNNVSSVEIFGWGEVRRNPHVRCFIDCRKNSFDLWEVEGHEVGGLAWFMLPRTHMASFANEDDLIREISRNFDSWFI